MLQSIREHTQGWIAGIIISIIILTFALWGIHSYFVGVTNNNSVAEVNGVEITKEQLAVSYERLRRQLQNQYGLNHPISSKDETNLKNRAMQSLIDLEVLKQASAKQGFIVTDRQIDNYLQSMPEFQVDGQFSLDKFQEILSSTLLSTSEFLELIRESLLIDQPKLGIVFTSISLPAETANTISLVNQERDIEYTNIDTQSFLSQPIIISPEKIQAYYNQHKAEFMTPEQASVEYIELSLKDLAAKFNPTDAMLKSFYNENINAYTQPTQWKIISVEIPLKTNATQADMQQMVKDGKALALSMKESNDLSKIAGKYSASLKELDWMTLTQMSPEMQKVVSVLTKAGDVSLPFKTKTGLMLVKVVDVQGPKILTFEMVKDKVKEAYIRQHAEEKFSDLKDQLADLTYEHPDSLEFAASNLSLAIQSSELFTKDKPGNDISQHKKIRDAAFSHDVMSLQNNSDLIQLNPETVVVIHIKSHIASALLPLKKITKQIEDKLKQQEAINLTAKFAQTLLNKLNTGADKTQITHAYQLKWINPGLIGRYSTKVDTAILDLAFRMPNPINVKNKIIYGIARLSNGFAIVALKSIKPGSLTDIKQLTIYSEQLENSNGLLEYELYKRSQIKHSEIEVKN